MVPRHNSPVDLASRTSSGLGPASADRYAPGDVIDGKYRLVQKRGEGGMGSVWVALNTALDIQVALKLIRGGVRYAAAAQRLLREARATARVQHPAIIKVFDFGATHHDDPYIVMELLAGQTLAEMLQTERPLGAEQAVHLLLPIAGGLMAAHARGVVHRDLKPDNIFLAEIDTGTLQPVVLDFGIVKLVGPAQNLRLTMSGPVGTPAYMSPEQVLDLDMDHRTDVWTFCVVLYEALASESLFQGGSHEDVLTAVLQKPIASLVGTGGVDEKLWAILQRGLRRDREERWPSFEALGEALAQWLFERGVREDVTGASLQARWLGHPSFAPRVSRPVALPPPIYDPEIATRGAEPGIPSVEHVSSPPHVPTRSSIPGPVCKPILPASDFLAADSDAPGRESLLPSVPPAGPESAPAVKKSRWARGEYAPVARLLWNVSALAAAALLGFAAQGTTSHAAAPPRARAVLHRIFPATGELGKTLLGSRRPLPPSAHGARAGERAR